MSYSIFNLLRPLSYIYSGGRNKTVSATTDDCTTSPLPSSPPSVAAEPSPTPPLSSSKYEEEYEKSTGSSPQSPFQSQHRTTLCKDINHSRLPTDEETITPPPVSSTTNNAHPNITPHYTGGFLVPRPLCYLPSLRMILLIGIKIIYALCIGLIITSLLESSLFGWTWYLLYWMGRCGSSLIGFIGLICSRKFDVSFVREQTLSVGEVRTDWFSSLLFGVGMSWCVYYTMTYPSMRDKGDRLFPNVPRQPSKIGYKSKRHRDCPTRRMRRKYSYSRDTKSIETSWIKPRPKYNPLPSMLFGLPAICIVSHLHVVNICCCAIFHVVDVCLGAIALSLAAPYAPYIYRFVVWMQQFTIQLRYNVDGNTPRVVDCCGVDRWVTIGELKYWISGRLGIAHCELGFNGIILDDDTKTLSAYNIKNWCALTIHIIGGTSTLDGE